LDFIIDFKEERIYSKLKEEELYRTMWRTRFGICCGPIYCKTDNRMNKCMNELIN